MLSSASRWGLAVLLLWGGAQAGVTRVEVSESSPVLGGRAFGAAGAYTRIAGQVHFEVDPSHPANRLISDIELAPRNARGRVEFSADLYLLQPEKGNGSVLFEVGNRGRKGLLGKFNRGRDTFDPRSAEDFGDGFLLEQGYTLAWLGWQADVHEHIRSLYTDVESGAPPEPYLLRFRAPAVEGVGGLVRSDFVPDRKMFSFHLADRTHRPYPVADPQDPAIVLTVREEAEGPRRTIPRDQWQFAREEKGKPVPSRAHVFVDAGLQPGKIYEIIYPAENPVLVGLGMAAVRDFISFLKQGGQAPGSQALRTPLRFALAFGSSQSGRFLRTFLYFGMNGDEAGRTVFDGIWANVAGAGRGSFNHRFAQPSRDARPFFNFVYPTDLFPFSDLEQDDPATKSRDGLLARTLRDGQAPKIFYTNSSYEYYGRSASLIHTTPDGRRDFDPAPHTRIYLIAGAQHGPGSFPPRRSGTQNKANPNDFRWLMRALLTALDSWVRGQGEPPASRYPRIAEGTLVPLGELDFPEILGVRRPTRILAPRHMDFGPEFRSRGIITQEPPRTGAVYPTLVPQVGKDGNELAGVLLPVVQVPLATYAGWNLRSPEIGAPDELFSMVGSFLPFPKTEEERRRSGDPRRSVAERYGSRDAYLEEVRRAAEKLAAEGYLLERDLDGVVAQAAEQWDYLIGSPGDETISKIQ